MSQIETEALTAIVLELQPLEDTSIPLSHGVFAYAAALDLLGRLDIELPKRIHDPAHNKPITVSSVQGGFREGYSFKLLRNRIYRWRLTGLNKAVSSQLNQLSPELGNIRLSNAIFRILNVRSDARDDSDTGQTTYANLLELWKTNDLPSTFHIEFRTPTTFRQNDFEVPFPTPHLVFGSLAKTWNTYAPQKLGDVTAVLKDMIMLSNWRGETRRVELGSRRTVGFIGHFTYRVAENLPEVRRLLGLLADYAFYSGIGWQTTHGLGQTRYTKKH